MAVEWLWMGCEFRRHHSQPSREPFIVLSRSAYLCRCGDRDGRASENPFSLGAPITGSGRRDGARSCGQLVPYLRGFALDQGSFTSLVMRDVVAGAGHFLPREKPEATWSAMLKLLQKA